MQANFLSIDDLIYLAGKYKVDFVKIVIVPLGDLAAFNVVTDR